MRKGKKEKGKRRGVREVSKGLVLISFIYNAKELGLYFESCDEPLKCFKHKGIRLQLVF